MPRKTRIAAWNSRTSECFNEAAARCRGKLAAVQSCARSAALLQ